MYIHNSFSVYSLNILSEPNKAGEQLNNVLESRHSTVFLIIILYNNKV